MRDLFGNEVTLEEARVLLKRARKEPTPSGYAAKPGTGPEGETCGSCAHLVRKHLARVYLKCGRNAGAWTGGRKSDVLARAPACSKWEAGEAEAKEAGR